MKRQGCALLAGLLLCCSSFASGSDTAMQGSAPAAGSALASAPRAAANSEPPYAAKLRKDAEAVFTGPDFHQMESGLVPVARPWLEQWLKQKKKTAPKAGKAPDFSGIAQIMKVLVIVLLTALLGWLLWRGYQWLTPQLAKKGNAGRRTAARAAESLALPEHSPLPERISDSALRAWQSGQSVAALSLLYRGAVAVLDQRDQLSLPRGATEGDYQRLLRRSGRRELASGFTIIAEAWLAQAYAGRSPADFSRLLETYKQHFEAAGSAS